MKTGEKSLWKWLARASHPRLHMGRIENAVSKSFPDVEGCLEGGCCTIELKTAARPKRVDTKVRFKFQPGQVEWLERRWACGGNAWLLVQIGSGSDAARYLIAGKYARDVAAGMEVSELFWMSHPVNLPGRPLGPLDFIYAATKARAGQ